ncbi:MAG: RraA family protein [Planctomycetota bacterium]|jgi:regulator of RNase E activity RraA|nr:RraA family protein [Planctomycetota bacterium]
MAAWNNDSEMSALMKERLYTPVVGDILDTMGSCHQFLPPPGIRPIDTRMKLAGRTMTVLMTDAFGPQKKPFGLLTEALDQLRENEVYVAGGGGGRCAYWGELPTVTARRRKAAGAVVNGWHRDTPQVLEQNWPVFSCGCYAQDSGVRAQVAAFRCQIEIGQVTLRDGDLVFGDIDGVVIIPQDVADGVLEKALEKAAGEKAVRKAIEDGMTATAAFAKFGIL